MFLKRRMMSQFWGGLFALWVLQLSGCVTRPPMRPLTISEQIEVDKERAQSLSLDFSRQVSFTKLPRAEKFLDTMARRLAMQEPGFAYDRIQVKVHDDHDVKLRRFFSFPGTLISIPASFLNQVEFENELAAALSYEIANVLNRHLATKVDAQTQGPIILFGPKNLFELSNAERSESIHRGIKLLYLGGYDPRGMPSIFKRYAEYYSASASGLFKKQVDFNIREAQRAKSEFLPSLKPIVRSGEFIQFKKELGGKE